MGKVTNFGRALRANGHHGVVNLDDGRRLTFTVVKFDQRYEWDRSDGKYGQASTLDQAKNAAAQG